MSVVWRADGQEIATMLPGQDFNSAQSSVKVTIFDAHTGKQVRTLTVKGHHCQLWQWRHGEFRLVAARL